jgi:pilus assembly protein FimV
VKRDLTFVQTSAGVPSRWRGAVSAVAAAALLACAGPAYALGLGRMSVQSVLGEPLLAEIDITTLTAEQAASLRVNIAPAEVYRAAGMEFTEVLRGVRVEVARRADGRAVLRVSSDRAARDPFVDLILQATWASGRLVREYTVLLDPPRTGQSAADAAESAGLADRSAAASTRAAPAARPQPGRGAPPAPAVPPAPAPAMAAAAPAVSTAAPVPAGRPAVSTTEASTVAPTVSTTAPAQTGAVVAGTGIAPSGPVLSTITPPPASEPGGSPDAALAAQAGQVVSTTSPSPAAAPAGAEPKARTTKPKAGRDKAAKAALADTESGGRQRHEVRAGETLSGIARDHRHDGVSLDQMLVALYRDNPDAFAGKNMNRLLAGAVLQVPAAQEAGSIPPAEARALIEAQSADLASYRQRLAAGAATVGQDSPQQRASGTVQARVQDRKQATAPTLDQLKLARGDVKSGATPEAALSRQAEKRELAQRETEVQRNVDALRQLQGAAGGGAPAGGAAQPGKGSAAAEPKAAAASAPAQPASAASALALTASLPGASEAVVAAASAPQAAASAAEAAKAPGLAASEPAPASRVQHSLLGNPYILVGGVALVAAVGVLAVLALLRRRRLAARSTSTPFGPRATDPGLGLDETAAAARQSPRAAFADALADAENTGASVPVLDDAVQDQPLHGQRPDPMAEAEVYLAYGRFEEAIALLRQAMRDEPDRSDIVFKLLELHASRQEVSAFQAVADVMQRRTGGQGADWARVVALQRAMTGQDDTPVNASPSLAPTFAPDAAPAAGRQTAPGLVATSAPLPSRLDGRTAPPAPAQRQEPELGPEPADMSSGDFALDVDVAAPSGTGGRAGGEDVDTRAPAEVPGTLERKLALAEEFIQIGDVEGARELLGEVGDQGVGPLKERARRLLDALDR